jgi:UDP-N-acetylglucosamine diphosphorylase/glucosamine-1-phosphate N-acetyltransferase
MRLCVFEDRGSERLTPLADTRPVFDLRCGARTLLSEQLAALPRGPWGLLVRPHLLDVCQLAHPVQPVNDLAWLRASDALMVNGRWLPPLNTYLAPLTPQVGLVGDQVAYARVPVRLLEYCSPQTLDECLRVWRMRLPNHEVGGTMIDYPWNLIADLPTRLAAQPAVTPAVLPKGCALIGPANQLDLHPLAHVEPGAVFDTSTGPITVAREATIQAFSRIQGPCWIGPRTMILGASVKASAIGPGCRVGGEVEASILHEYVNKYHVGFVGHSYVGAWVNIGAGTQFSDLRSDYATVIMETNHGPIDTGMVKVGSFIGDHAKLGLNVLLNTGTTIGCYTHVYPNGSYAPRRIPAMVSVWKGKLIPHRDLAGLQATARMVLSRRDWPWLPAHAALLRQIFTANQIQRPVRLARRAA